MVKKAKLLLVTVLVFSLFTFLGATAYAAKTAKINLTALDDDLKTPVSGLTVTVYDAAENDVTTGQGITVSESSGVYSIANITTKGAYNIKLTSPNAIDAVTVPVLVTSVADTAVVKTARVTFIKGAAAMDTKRSGVLGGLTLDASQAALSDVKVKAYTATATYETKSDSNGFYKLYLPTGSYTVVVYGKDSTGVDDHKNVFSTVKVTAGQLSGPLDDMNAQTDWTNNADTAGYTLTQMETNNKIVKGYANKNSTVSIYKVDSEGNYALLGSKKITSTTGAAVKAGAFSISLADYIEGGSKISVKVVDQAFNVYEDKTKVTTPFPLRTMNVTNTTTSASINLINTKANVTYADAGGTTMLTNLTAKITSVTAVGVTTPESIVLVKGTNYTVASGKITFNAGVLDLAQSYKITVWATGYTSAQAIQVVGPSVKAAAAITGTFTAVKGDTEGSTKFTSIGTAKTGNSLKYMISNTLTLQKQGNPLEATTTVSALTANADITGVNSTTNKYIQIYEVKNSDNTIVGAKLITLTIAQICPPKINSVYVDGTTVKLVADVSLKSTAPATAKFTVKAGTTVKTVSNVSVSGKSVTLTLSSAVTSGQAVTVNYVYPGATANPLQDSNSNAISTFTAAKAAVNLTITTDAANTTAPAVTLGASSVTSGNTLSATSNEGGWLYLVLKTTTKSLSALNAEVYAGTGSVIAATASQAASIPTTGLAAGTYVVYAVDWAGNISTVSGDVTVN